MTTTEQPRLRMDRSRDFATIHGERSPGDPHLNAHFQQDGIIFDAHGLHLDHLIGDNKKLRDLVGRRLARQEKNASKQALDDGEGVDATADDNDGEGVPGTPDVNIEAWLRGDAKYPWFAITKTVRDRYSQNITKMVDMLEFLVFDAKIVPEAELGPELKTQLRPVKQA